MTNILFWWVLPSIFAGAFNYFVYPNTPQAEDESFLQAVIFTIVWPITVIIIFTFTASITINFMRSRLGW